MGFTANSTQAERKLVNWQGQSEETTKNKAKRQNDEKYEDEKGIMGRLILLGVLGTEVRKRAAK
jgi:hypothetical protein